MNNIIENLSRPSVYIESLNKLHKKLLLDGSKQNKTQGGVPLRNFIQKKKRIASLLAKGIKSETFTFSPVRLIKIPKGDSFRLVYSLEITDLIVHTAMANELGQAVDKVLSPNLYSYRKGKTRMDAIKAFCTYLRQHEKTTTNVKQRGIYLLRCDVTKYTENIPVGGSSPLWQMLEDIFHNHKRFKSGLTICELAQSALRSGVVSNDTALFSNYIGLPTGSPLTNVLANLYLTDLDYQLSTIDNSFYCRFGDDILFSHTEEDKFHSAVDKIKTTLKDKGLHVNDDKFRISYMNGAGKRAPDSSKRLQSCASVEFLGLIVSFSGLISLPPRKERRYIRDTCRMIDRANAHIQPTCPFKLCQATNEILNPNNVINHPILLEYMKYCDDRMQSKRIDRALALKIAELISYKKGLKAFRTIPYDTIRKKYQLRSITCLKNNGRF